MIMQVAFSRATFGLRKLAVLQNTEEVTVFFSFFLGGGGLICPYRFFSNHSDTSRPSPPMICCLFKYIELLCLESIVIFMNDYASSSSSSVTSLLTPLSKRSSSSSSSLQSTLSSSIRTAAIHSSF